MNGLFGNFGCGGGFFGRRDNCDNKNCGMDCCTIILILLLLSCSGCFDIDWCTIIVIYILFSCGCVDGCSGDR